MAIYGHIYPYIGHIWSYMNIYGHIWTRYGHIWTICLIPILVIAVFLDSIMVLPWFWVTEDSYRRKSGNIRKPPLIPVSADGVGISGVYVVHIYMNTTLEGGGDEREAEERDEQLLAVLGLRRFPAAEPRCVGVAAPRQPLLVLGAASDRL